MKYRNVYRAVSRLQYATPLMLFFVAFPMLLRVCISVGILYDSFLNLWASMNLFFGVAGGLPFLLAHGAAAVDRRNFRFGQISASIAMAFFVQSCVVFKGGIVADFFRSAAARFSILNISENLIHDFYYDLVNIGGYMALLFALLFALKDILALADKLECEEIFTDGNRMFLAIVVLLCASVLTLVFSFATVDSFSENVFVSSNGTRYGSFQRSMLDWIVAGAILLISVVLVVWTWQFVRFLKFAEHMLAEAEIEPQDSLVGAAVLAEQADAGAPEAEAPLSALTSEDCWDSAMEHNDPKTYARMMRQMELQVLARTSSRVGAAVDVDEKVYTPYLQQSKTKSTESMPEAQAGRKDAESIENMKAYVQEMLETERRIRLRVTQEKGLMTGAAIDLDEESCNPW